MRKNELETEDKKEPKWKNKHKTFLGRDKHAGDLPNRNSDEVSSWTYRKPNVNNNYTMTEKTTNLNTTAKLKILKAKSFMEEADQNDRTKTNKLTMRTTIINKP